MSPTTDKDEQADEWFNTLINKLRFEQDYYVFPGSSKKMFNEKGEQNGISIKRPDIRLFSTGVTKLYEMLVDGKELPDVEYTEDEENRFDENMRKRFPEVFAKDETEELK